MSASIDTAISEIRASDAFVVIGAGASFHAGMPLAGQLSPIVWHVLDSVPKMRDQVCKKLGVAFGTAKRIVADDWKRISTALEYIAEDAVTRRVFQNSVCDLNKSRCRDLSAPHDAIARLIFAGRITGILSLNWDTLLENAFRRRYGFWPSNDTFDFWKPHGDCADEGQDWVLPHEPGVISDSIVRRVSEFANARPRVLLIIGYSERDETVVERLIAPMSDQWRVYRLSPGAVGEGAIRMDAGTALEHLADELTPMQTQPGWNSVSFDNQRGIEAAIVGERLGPGDVVSCPRLPHYSSALAELDILHRVNIAGTSGSGKSITIWQLAHHYNQAGWHVIRLSNAPRVTNRQRIDIVAQKRWPTVVVVDDTQSQPEDFLDAIRAMADTRTKVLFGTTDANWEQQNTIRVSSVNSVKALAKEFKRRRDEILPIVQKFDSHVGDNFHSIRLEDRIDSAVDCPTPWQFAYALRGGWRQTRHILNAAADFVDNAHLLTAIAARQLSSLDGGCSTEELESDAKTLGHDSEWVSSALQRLESQRVILVGQTIRCLHLRSAAAIVELSLDSKSPDEAKPIIDILRSIVEANHVPLRGISWLLNEVRNYRSKILTADIKALLLKRCLNAFTHIERRDACFVLAHLLGWREITASELLDQAARQLHLWVADVKAEDAYGIASLINNLYNDDECLCRNFVGGAEPGVLAAKLSNVACEDGYAWGHLLGRLGCGCPQEWSDRFSAEIPRDAVLKYVGEFSGADLRGLTEFIHGVASFDLEFALDCVESAMSIYKAEFAYDSLQAYRKTSELEHWVLGNPWFGKAKPSVRQRTLARTLLDSIDPPTLVEQSLTCPFGDWENYARLLVWMQKVHVGKIRQIVASMDWDRFDAVIGDKWKSPPRELRLFLSGLTTNNDGEPVRSWIEGRADRIEKIDPILAGISPNAAIRIVRKGNIVDLGAHNRSDWDLQTWTLARIASEDKEAARTVLRQNTSHFTTAIAELSAPDGLPRLIEIALELDKGFIPEILGKLSADDVREKWVTSLHDHRKDERYAGRQVLRKVIALGDGPLCDLADELLRSVRYKNKLGTT